MRPLQRPDFSRRSTGLEIMDDLSCQGPVVHQTLKELEFINRRLGGNQVTLDAVDQLARRGKSSEPITIADLGCGGGDILKCLAANARKKGLSMKFTGIDANPHIVEFAKRNCSGYPEIEFEVMDVLSAEFQERKYDIILGTLFFHHFSDSVLIALLSSLHRQAALGLVINDIHRHWFSYYSIRLLTRYFSRSDMVKFDAPLSVLRAFTRNEWISILAQCGIRDFTLVWKWAFRWKITTGLR